MTGRQDPGWRPAIRLAGRIAALRSGSAEVLTVMRAAAVFLGAAAVISALIALLLTGAAGDPRIETLTAQIVMAAAIGVSAAAGAWAGRGGVGDREGPALAIWLFRTTMRRMLFSAAVGPVGLFVSWYSADRVWIIYGTGAAVILISLVAPTTHRIAAWQDDAAEGVSVLDALLLRYR